MPLASSVTGTPSSPKDDGALAAGGGGVGTTSTTSMKLRKRQRPTIHTTASSTTTSNDSSTSGGRQHQEQSSTSSNINCTTKMTMQQQIAYNEKQERQQKQIVRQCQQNVTGTFLSSKHTKFFFGLIGCAVCIVGYYYYTIVQKRYRQQRIHYMKMMGYEDIDIDNLNQTHVRTSSLPPVLRHVIMLYPPNITVRQKLPLFFGRYSIATHENIDARRTLQQYTKKNRFFTYLLPSGDTPAAYTIRDRILLYGWERRDFENQLSSDQSNNNSTIVNRMDQVCGGGFANAYLTTKIRRLQSIQDDMIYWCLLANHVHDGFVSWQFDELPSRSISTSTATRHDRNGISDMTPNRSIPIRRNTQSNYPGLLTLQPAYYGLAIQYYNQTRIVSSLLMMLPMSLPQPPPGSNSHQNKQHSQDDDPVPKYNAAMLPHDVIDWIIREKVWRSSKKSSRALVKDVEEAYKQKFEVWLYDRILTMIKESEKVDQKKDESTVENASPVDSSWILLQAVCRGSNGSKISNSSITTYEDEEETFRIQLRELDKIYRRVGGSGCTLTLDQRTLDQDIIQQDPDDIDASFCKCIIYHPKLKPLKERPRRRKVVVND